MKCSVKQPQRRGTATPGAVAAGLDAGRSRNRRGIWATPWLPLGQDQGVPLKSDVSITSAPGGTDRTVCLFASAKKVLPAAVRPDHRLDLG